MNGYIESESDSEFDDKSNSESTDESDPVSEDEFDWFAKRYPRFSTGSNRKNKRNSNRKTKRYSNRKNKKSDPEDEGPQEGLIFEIISTIKQIKTPNAFAYSATDLFLPNPVLHVKPHGTLGLPLSTDDAKKIISQAHQSPFGKGEKTLVDTTVRKSWELNPNQFSLKNPAWKKTIKDIVDSVKAGLGLGKGSGRVTAKLYKLLLYEPGAFFKPHKDSEKAPGMFATLVVCLPSPHEGGKLVLTHDNEKQEFETASSSSFGCSYAAWYSDITHEVLPVVSGYRLVLTYNLIRPTKFEIPSHDLNRGHVKQLMTLLEQYNSQLEEGEEELAPILVHKLEHKYSQANLKLGTLKPPDVAQVLSFSQVAAKLGFDVYLATLELSVNTIDEHVQDPDYEQRHQSLDNMVDLDGKLVDASFDYPEELEPIPQAENRTVKEEHEGYTGNEGSPATFWYQDTVVVLVPPAKQLDFIFKLKSDGTIVDSLFCKLIQKLATDPTKKQELEQLCERALKPKINDPNGTYYYKRQFEKSVPQFCQEAAAVALDLGRMDLFDEACKTTRDEIMLNNAHALGRWAAENGIATMTDRLMKGVLVAPSVPKKVEFVKAVTKGFETAKQTPSFTEKESLKKWSDEAIFEAVAQLTSLKKADGVALAQLCKMVDWSCFESKTKPVMLNAVALTKIAFVDKLMSTLKQKLDKKQRSFIEMIVYSIWKEFVFDTDLQTAASSSLWDNERKDNIKENDVLYIVEKTVAILSPKCVETTIIPGMLNAVRNASDKCTKELFVPLAQTILKNEFAGFTLRTNAAVPPPSHKRVVQALLTKFLLKSVSMEPHAPTDWSLRTTDYCYCKVCAVVKKFLQDPHQQSFDYSCSLNKISHLRKHFKVSKYDYNHRQSSFDISVIGDYSPVIFRITKHRRPYEKTKSEWMDNVKSIQQTLSKLEKTESAKGRLKAYLQPYYSIIMSASINKLPDLEYLLTVQSSETDENAAPAHNQLKPTTHKRGTSSDLSEEELAKRMKS